MFNFIKYKKFEKKILKELESLPIIEPQCQLEYRDAFNAMMVNLKKPDVFRDVLVRHTEKLPITSSQALELIKKLCSYMDKTDIHNIGMLYTYFLWVFVYDWGKWCNADIYKLNTDKLNREIRIEYGLDNFDLIEKTGFIERNGFYVFAPFDRKKSKEYLHYKKLRSKGLKIAKKATDHVSKMGKKAKESWDENKDSIPALGKEALKTGKEFASSSCESATNNAKGFYRNMKYSDKNLKVLETRIENQGGYYRELNRNKATVDSVVIGGETLASLLSASTISDEIINAYEAAYPGLSKTISFQDKVRELDSDSLTGFISGVKGKLFEQKYVEYLNDGNLPDGYSAILAESATQPGWDIAIKGGNGEIASVLAAKTADSLDYVQDALEKYPNIDVVTTDEVYSHLVMNGISENITNGSISNVELVDALDGAVDASELAMDYMPPLFALAFIAFTSYKDESLTLFEKSRNAGDRTGKTYLSYLIGGGIAAITNTWWLGIVGSVCSRLLCEGGNRKFAVYEKLKVVEVNNQAIIDRLKT